MPIKVVNVQDYGGLLSATKAGVVYVGRPSVLGNPFPITEHPRAESISLFRTWLFEKLKERDVRVVAALEALKEDSVIGCWCKPLDCHAEVIASAWNWWVCQGGRDEA